MIKNKPLKKGTKAPQFNLKATPDQNLALSDFAGTFVVLIFYPADFSPVCQDEVSLFNKSLSKFKKHNAQVLAISVDNVWSHLAFMRERRLRFPLLSDFHPKGKTSKLYNAYREEDGEAERAIYIIDKDGIIAWAHKSPLGLNPGPDGALKALEELIGNKNKTL